MALAMCARLGMDGGDYQAIQYSGKAVQNLDIAERMTMCNMAAELGGQVGMIEPDELTAEYITGAGADPGDWQSVRGDADAVYLAEHRFDAAALPPQVAAPHSPANSAPIDEVEAARLDQCYIGACTGAKLDDLHMAARVLAGRQRVIAAAVVRRARLDPYDCRGSGRRYAGHIDRSGRHPAAIGLRRLCRFRRGAARRRRGLPLLDGA